MNTKPFSLSTNTIDREDLDAVIQVLESGRYTQGEKVAEFEKQVAQWTGAKEAVYVNSGSSANLLMVDALIRGRRQGRFLELGDEVLVPALSWPTSVWPIVQLGLTPVFVDICPDTLAIDVASAEEALTSKTKAVMLLHIMGLAADMQKITAFCEKNDLILLEDACESFGAYFQERHVGTFGLCGTLSHYFSHHLTTIEGGSLITNDSQLADDLRSKRSHGWIRDRSDKDDISRKYSDLDPRFLFTDMGYNVRGTELSAALGLKQLSKVDHMLESRDTFAHAFHDEMKDVPWLEIVGYQHIRKGKERHGRRHSLMNLPLRLTKNAPLSLTQVKEIFEQGGIETRPFLTGNLLKHPVCEEYNFKRVTNLNCSDELANRGFLIGSAPSETDQAIALIHNVKKRLLDV